MIKFIAHLLCLAVYPFSFLIPRSRGKWAFGSYRGLFNDNSKYMFIEMSRAHPEMDLCWLSTKKSTVSHIRSMGLNSLWVLSPSGLWYALRAKYWVVNAYSQDIMFCLSGGATVVNLWHGIGLKRCEFNIQSGPLAKRFVDKTLYERITHPESFRRPDFLLTVSDFQTPMFAKAFRVKESQCIKAGYPRNAIMLADEDSRKDFIAKYESEAVSQLVSRLHGYDKVFIYMPTWRDSQLDIFRDGFDLGRLNDLMAKKSSLMLLKPHPNTKVDRSALKGYGNVALVEGISDIYPVLPYCDVLITDYSSILYDYILIPGKDVVLYLYDYKEYQGMRDFYYPFDENVVGKKVYDFEHLYETISTGDYRMNETQRQIIIERFWGHTDFKKPVKAIMESIIQ